MNLRLNWHQTPTKIEIKHWMNGAAVFELGKYQVTISHPAVTPEADDLAVSYMTGTGDSDPRKTFPGMEVSEGVLRIPVEDIVGELLTRLEPADLARALWAEPAVREEFMYCMVTTYADGALSDADRRKFMHDVQVTVHADAVRHLAARFSESEWNLCRSVHFWDQIQRANSVLQTAEERVRLALGQPVEPADDYPGEVFKIMRIRDSEQDPLTRVAGTVWGQSRAYWLNKVAELFPAPVEEKTDDIF